MSITLIAAVVLLPSFGHGLGYTTLGYSYITGDKEATGIRGIVDLSVL